MLKKLFRNILREIKNNKSAVLFIFIAIILKSILILSFSNTDWEPDSYMHYLELKTVYTSFPEFLPIGLGVWSKPLYTYLLGIPVYLSSAPMLILVQMTNLLIFSIISYLTYKITIIITHNKLIALISIGLTAFTLTLLKSSTSALTEPIFTLVLILGFYWALKSKYYLSSILIGLSILGRIEGLFFIGIYFIWLMFQIKSTRKIILHGIILAIPGAIWNLLGFLSTGYLLYIFDNGYPTVSGTYGYGQLYSMIWSLLSREPLILGLFSIGAAVLVIKIKRYRNHSAVWLAATWAILFIAVQSILWWKGLFGSAGLIRYFVSILPFMIIVGCYGLQKIEKILPTNKVLFILIISLQLFITSFYFLGIIPAKKEFPPREETLIVAGEWISKNTNKSDFLGSDRPEVIYYANRDLSNSTIFYKEYLHNKKPGYYVWTKSWGEAVSKVPKSDLEQLGDIVLSIEDEVFIYKIN